MMSFVWMTALVALAQIASDAYRKFDVDTVEGDCWDDRWLAWGTCRSFAKNPNYDFRYFRLHLPISRWGKDYCRNVECWTHLVLYKFAGRWHRCWVPDR